MIVYITKNKVDGKQYIGKLTSLKKTWYLGSGTRLLHAVKKYGKENFIRETLEVCKDKDHLNEREKYWIDFYDAIKSKQFYNIIPGGQGGFLSGVDHPRYGATNTKDANEKNRLWHLGKRYSSETNKKKAMMGRNNPSFSFKNFIDPDTGKIIFTGNLIEFSKISGIPHSTLKYWYRFKSKVSLKHKLYKIEKV